MRKFTLSVYLVQNRAITAGSQTVRGGRREREPQREVERGPCRQGGREGGREGGSKIEGEAASDR
jgi:hypothetical protein